ncbi:MAG: DNA glycosylase [Candidatus Lumbricidophila eiseniae]|uniref:DNA-(apurinic or apyrimidinic site) lyase n=1 Tax=Candidatus Lumbricidiphila eiseniae TaxID=1969409 RepID=A0A2A6FQJ1_9MICO|nr:MAG: DNA glycosylase [Candidatus Lumbricidophila eiseniae]
MPEGHSVHRIARQFERNFVGHRVRVSSPQGRFAVGAASLDSRVMTSARAIGKQMFLEFEGERWLRVHLGIYGAWDFAGDILMDATIMSANGRMGQTGQRGTVFDSAGENSVTSIGAPRRTRLRMSEGERETDVLAQFPPEPIGQVRVRLFTDSVCADLRGPTVCEVLDPAQVAVMIGKLGPDPLCDPSPEAEERFVRRVRARATSIGLLLMDQSVVAGIGNVYRAEILFRARLDPYRPGRSLTEEQTCDLWRDWAQLLRIGVETGQMMTMNGLDAAAYRAAMANRADRHWVYKREGLPCRVCGTDIVLAEMATRKLYWCPECQR